MKAEMLGLFLEPRSEVGSVALFVVVLADTFVSCAGEGIKAKTRQVMSRVAGALRQAAQALSKSALGEYCRRMKARLGAPDAITATAHKLACILDHLTCAKRTSDDADHVRAGECVALARFEPGGKGRI
jgi:hypothetical protein